MPFDRSSRDVDSNRRRRVEVVAGALIAHPRTTVPCTPEREVRFRVVIASDPHGGAASLPLIALGPRLTTGLARSGNGVGFPELLAALEIVRGNKPSHAQLAA